MKCVATTCSMIKRRACTRVHMPYYYQTIRKASDVASKNFFPNFNTSLALLDLLFSWINYDLMSDRQRRRQSIICLLKQNEINQSMIVEGCRMSKLIEQKPHANRIRYKTGDLNATWRSESGWTHPKRSTQTHTHTHKRWPRNEVTLVGLIWKDQKFAVEYKRMVHAGSNRKRDQQLFYERRASKLFCIKLIRKRNTSSTFLQNDKDWERKRQRD